MNKSQTSKQFFKSVVLAAGVLFFVENANAQSTALDAAVAAASQWATLADANQSERMWAASGPVMQKSINKEDWAKYVTNLRNDLGTLNGREWAEVVRVGQPDKLPKGEYVNVVFSSRFSKTQAGEAVSLVLTSGRWVPVGYVVHKIPVGAANGIATAPVK
ncbi:DUF4019 domain-containing protein [Glaciimonas immobilis]|uniref:DUF4019 domain-containing protein n=1 Tax=Glaciimonas immobilis TaxID=728004 RepID=A0A840S1N9_9BURK|nr:DUF4019 domain-containing protein [Glaciimonas immobilis]KAF3996682.1 DUF4019 domain-containing protein [Glaciimonas immobilis]MBB5202530.1 hypothetical protein [Glaciimonas immobilis]